MKRKGRVYYKHDMKPWEIKKGNRLYEYDKPWRFHNGIRITDAAIQDQRPSVKRFIMEVADYPD